MFKVIIEESFLTQKTNESWHEKRKACSHAFYKERLQMMMKTLQQKIIIAINKWKKEIEQNPQGYTDIDITSEFERIFSRNIIEISFGEDVSDEKFDFNLETFRGSGKFNLKKVSLREAFHENNQLFINSFTTKFFNPINLFWRYTGKVYSATPQEKMMDDNARRIRAYVRSYIQKRKSGERESKVADKVDLLSLFFSSPEVFTEQVIIDELIDFFGAASETTQNAT